MTDISYSDNPCRVPVVFVTSKMNSEISTGGCRKVTVIVVHEHGTDNYGKQLLEYRAD